MIFTIGMIMVFKAKFDGKEGKEKTPTITWNDNQENRNIVSCS